jgi:hypothetical protein
MNHLTDDEDDLTFLWGEGKKVKKSKKSVKPTDGFWEDEYYDAGQKKGRGKKKF